MKKWDDKAFKELQQTWREINAEVTRLVKNQKGKNCAGTALVHGYLLGILKSLKNN